MASSIFYPRTVSTPRKIAQNACPQNMAPDEFERRFLAANWQTASANSNCPPNRPVIVPSADQAADISISPLLTCTSEEQKNLFSLSQYAGGAAVMGLANLLWETRIPNVVGDLNTFGGNGMGAAVAKSSKVLEAIDKYDFANKQYQDLKNHRAAPRMVNAAKLRAGAAFKEMNQVLYSKSLNYLNKNTFGMRQTTNATGRTVWESIPVRDTADVQKLAKFAKVGRVLGPGVILLDGYIRANGVYHTWQSGGNWEREAVVQGGSFFAGLGAGAVIGTVIALTPVGLVIGVVAGGAIAVGADYLVKDLINLAYDMAK
ncbi:hypothetical protein [Hydrocarboniclastica marina]|uniref:Uncharacterized protein n=1 Tax=Hydrocarboniclastica marina TaxID=2259620 RepID=A0A4V1D923_9ALTE|nr:hypothetical protein [Hydrocarboniclastica marina]QCF27190.1 hypothetical protein soil367_15330 [Hydrocarboniclastica marina]